MTVHSGALMLSLFFFTDTATTEIYTLSLHDALPISPQRADHLRIGDLVKHERVHEPKQLPGQVLRSEEHTSELQSHSDLVCRLLLEKKKNRKRDRPIRNLRYGDAR